MIAYCNKVLNSGNVWGKNSQFDSFWELIQLENKSFQSNLYFNPLLNEMSCFLFVFCFFREQRTEPPEKPFGSSSTTQQLIWQLNFFWKLLLAPFGGTLEGIRPDTVGPAEPYLDRTVSSVFLSLSHLHQQVFSFGDETETEAFSVNNSCNCRASCDAYVWG